MKKKMVTFTNRRSKHTAKKDTDNYFFYCLRPIWRASHHRHIQIYVHERAYVFCFFLFILFRRQVIRYMPPFFFDVHKLFPANMMHFVINKMSHTQKTNPYDV